MAGRRELVIPKAPFIVPYRLQRNVIPPQASAGGTNPVGKTQAWVADFSVALLLT
ncbi:MAG: hypothetical protein WAU74_10605 [Pseudolabrys sp.]